MRAGITDSEITMRFAAYAVSLCVALSAHTMAQRPVQQGNMDPREITPRVIATLDSVSLGAVVTTHDGKRIYYTTFGRNEPEVLWLYDPNSKRSTRIADGQMGNLAISPSGDQMVFFRSVEDTKTTMIWTLPLDPKTGAASGPARRLALNSGDQPRFSPDGKWVAYAVYDSVRTATQHVAIVPASGGAERVVVRTDGGIGIIRWTPDGRSLVYMQLSRTGGSPQLFRVPVGGGVPTPMFIANGFGNPPGLSPDGRLIFVQEIGQPPEDFTVFDSAGTRLGRVFVPQPSFPRDWLNPTTIILGANVAPLSVRVVSLSDGSAREILPASISARNLFWSPDGSRVATIGVSSNRPTVLVMNPDGGNRRAIGISGNVLGDNLWWSPDGKYVMSRAKSPDSINIIDASTGTARALAARAGPMHWRSDSRAVFYLSNPATAGQRLAIHEVSLDGRNREVQTIPVDRPLGLTIRDSVALFGTDSCTFLLSMQTGQLTKLSSYRPSGAELDHSAQRIAIRRSQAGGDNQIEIVDPSGKRLANLEFRAFSVGPQATSRIFFHPDGRHLVLAGLSNGHRAIYMVPIDGSAPRKIADLPDSANPPAMALSPDGKHLVFSAAGRPSGQIAALDLSSFTRR
jgi:Tol biopolymer transport system component